MIVAEDIVKTFNGTTALDGVSFRVERGELFGLIGPDAAGKTTLLRILATLLKPDSGKARVMGYETVSEYRSIRRDIGYMPGRFSLYSDLTVEENLKFYASVFGTTVKANYHLIEKIYSSLMPFRKRQAGKLSGGMKQKLALCCALIHAPSLIILDEPTTGVDALSRREFWEMLAILAEKDITILVSTPYMDEAARCNRVALIQKGRIMKSGKPADLVKIRDKKIYGVSSASRYALIQALRDYRGIESANVFGSMIHITMHSDESISLLPGYLSEKGIIDAGIRELQPSIEDTFLYLMSKKDE
jgi:ABC-type multidrug transport system ATPase subunit